MLLFRVILEKLLILQPQDIQLHFQVLKQVSTAVRKANETEAEAIVEKTLKTPRYQASILHTFTMHDFASTNQWANSLSAPVWIFIPANMENVLFMCQRLVEPVKSMQDHFYWVANIVY